MLKIRLQRIGKKGQAYFRLVVTEHTVKAQGKYLELLGSYDPHKKTLTANSERTQYWLNKGAQMSVTANNLLIEKKVVTDSKYKKIKAWSAKPKAQNATA